MQMLVAIHQTEHSDPPMEQLGEGLKEPKGPYLASMAGEALEDLLLPHHLSWVLMDVIVGLQ